MISLAVASSSLTRFGAFAQARLEARARDQQITLTVESPVSRSTS